jgi:hypothetical protein
LPQSRRDEIVENFNIAEFFQKYNYSLDFCGNSLC